MNQPLMSATTAVQDHKDHPFLRISPDDVRLLAQLAHRAAKVVRDFKRERGRDDLIDPDVQMLMMDFMVAHVSRDLRLTQLLLTSDLEFVEEFVTIQRTLSDPKIRACLVFPSDVALRYANK